MSDKNEAVEVVSFPVVIPGDYSISGFKMRNPDNLYKVHEEFNDRHYKCSREFTAGEKLIAHICELRGCWQFIECERLVLERLGFFSNAVGLTLAFEQGERHLAEKLRRSLKRDEWPPKIIGLDVRRSFWWTRSSHTMIPLLRSDKSFLEIRWIFELTEDDYYGKSEDCLLYFTKT